MGGIFGGTGDGASRLLGTGAVARWGVFGEAPKTTCEAHVLPGKEACGSRRLGWWNLNARKHPTARLRMDRRASADRQLRAYVFWYGGFRVRLLMSSPTGEFLMPVLRAGGATDFFIHITYHCDQQCALGYDPAEMRMLADFGCEMMIDCWKDDDDEKMQANKSL